MTTGAATAPTGVFAPGRRALTTGLVLTITLVGFEGLAIATIMPVVNRDLGGLELYGWVFSAFFLGSLVGVVAAGFAADRRGPARPFVGGLALFALGLLGGGLAPSTALLVGARAVQGVGAGAIPAVAYVAIGRAYPAALQPRMFAVISTAWVLPGVIGPAISGAVADAWSWRWVFLGLLPLVVLAGTTTTPALVRLGSPGGAEPPDRRRDAVVLAAGAGLVLAGVSSRSPLAAPPLVIAGGVLGARAFLRLMPRGTLRLRGPLPAAVGLRGLATFAFFGTDAFVSLTLTSVHHVSATVAGIALTAATLTWTAGAWIQERRVRRTGPRAFARTGFLLIAAGIAGMIVTATLAVPVAAGVLAWGIAGLGMGVSYAPLSLVVLAEAPGGGEGTATASLQLCDTLGIALGTGVAGAIIASGTALGWEQGSALAIAFATCGAVALAASAGSVRLPSKLVSKR
ncbi:MAG TPA: MFS transporter [Acidimicrobiia bacterium]|nr:MFS transporter [Acidimicrobiia bacterium]